MKRGFFRPNLEGKGRWLRGSVALAMVAAGIGLLTWRVGVGLILIAAGGFVAYEAARGWCLLRACGIRTRF
jgi:hypothetical protein